MTVSVNPVQRPQSNDDALIGAALGIARDLFKVGFDERAAKRAAELQQKKEDAQLTKEEKELASNIPKTFKVVPKGTEGAFSGPQLGLKDPVRFGFGPDDYFIPWSESGRRDQVAKDDRNKKKESENQNFTRTQQIADDYRTESKPTAEAMQGYRKLEAAANNPNPTGATDLSLIFGFMKSIDPGSTVREGEFANAEDAQGAAQKYINLYNKVLQGERLTPEMRKNFLTEGRRAAQSYLEAQAAIDSHYEDMAKAFNVDPKYVLKKEFQDLRKRLGPLTKIGDQVAKKDGGGGGLIPSAQAAPSFDQPFDPDAYLRAP